MTDFLKANYHTHTTRCKHAYGTEREYIEAAIDMGIKKLGFSDHIPCPFDDGYVSGIRMTMDEAAEYVNTIRRLAAEYAKYIDIFVGFESEYVKEYYKDQLRMFYKLRADYMIMGQHFSHSEQVGPYFGTSTEDESRIRDYVDSIIEGMETKSYKYLAHPDLINYCGMDSVYDWEMTRLCKALKDMDIPLEINILGIGEGKHYPDEKRFWSIVSEVGNRVILGLDAHCIEHMRDVDSYHKAMQIVDKYALNLVDDIGL